MCSGTRPRRAPRIWPQLYKSGNERTKGFEINAFNYRSEAAGDRAKGQGALIGGIFSGVSTALGGATDVSKFKIDHPSIGKAQ
ncbi:hypothetical protein GCM10009087_52180 [Sphingomonas oligophenolica]